MKSRLLAGLERRIEQEVDPTTADCLRAERAAYLARMGDLIGAQRDLDAVRDRNKDRPTTKVIAWVNLAEGLVGYFRDLGASAIDKTKRAYVLSASGKEVAIQARAASWLAHFYYGLAQFDQMSLYAREALNLSSAVDHSTLARVSLVIAQALHAANRIDLALPWYRSAHRHAVADGDDSMVSAFMHNMASLRAANLRLFELGQSDTSEDACLARVGADSTRFYEHAIGSQGQDTFTPLISAQLLANAGQWQGSLELYEQFVPQSISQGLRRLHSWYLSDMAWCEVNRGQIESARIFAAQAEEAFQWDPQEDDRAASHARLSQVYRALGELAATEQHHLDATSLFRKFQLTQSRIVELLVELEPPVGDPT